MEGNNKWITLIQNPGVNKLDLTNQQTYQILVVIFPIIAFVWEKFLRNMLLPFLEKSTLVESTRRRNLFVGWMYQKHILITSILLGISAIFGILSIL